MDLSFFWYFLWIFQIYTDPVSKKEDHGFFENRPPLQHFSFLFLLSKNFFGRMDVPTNILWSRRFVFFLVLFVNICSKLHRFCLENRRLWWFFWKSASTPTFFIHFSLVKNFFLSNEHSYQYLMVAPFWGTKVKF